MIITLTLCCVFCQDYNIEFLRWSRGRSSSSRAPHWITLFPRRPSRRVRFPRLYATPRRSSFISRADLREARALACTYHRYRFKGNGKGNYSLLHNFLPVQVFVHSREWIKANLDQNVKYNKNHGMKKRRRKISRDVH
ncbi:hypothetical protein PUN28_002466 [Cardiocondyla obscurior]|uniref:Uncharacterized protein n=1 Tax=Cardiocondyla obscurior TaxID=286306 RepID=A0AAW2GUE3_9HYME